MAKLNKIEVGFGKKASWRRPGPVIHILIVAAILAVLSGSLSCQKGYSGPVDSITIGTTISEVNSLILIAREQGYFAGNGLNVTYKIYPSGVAAVNGMISGEADMVTGSEFAFAGNVLSQKNIRTIGAISRASGEYLVGRVGRGINSIQDLKGKTIGVPLKSRPEFALDVFLLLRGIDPSRVTLINVPVDQSVDALMSGTVDAVTAWQPYINQIKKGMGEGVVVWDVQEDQPSYTVVMCTGKFTVESLDPVKRFLKSLVQAESYNVNNPGAAKALIQKELNYDDKYMEDVWPDYNFSVLLEQSFVLAMEDEARWMISNNLTAEKTVPNFLDYIYADGLKSVKPNAVRISGK